MSKKLDTTAGKRVRSAQLQPHVGNIVFALDGPLDEEGTCLFMVRKGPKNDDDDRRKRKRIGIDKWCPAGGGKELEDHSQKHAAQRELLQESGNVWEVPLGNLIKIGVLRNYLLPTPYSVGRWDWSAHLHTARLRWVVHLYATLIPERLRNKHKPSPEENIVETAWFPIKSLPWAHMIPCDVHWVPQILRAERMNVDLLYAGAEDGDDGFVTHRIVPKGFFAL